MTDSAAIRRSLLDRGFAVVPGVLDAAALAQVGAAAQARLDAAPADQLARHRTTGTCGTSPRPRAWPR